MWWLVLENQNQQMFNWNKNNNDLLYHPDWLFRWRIAQMQYFFSFVFHYSIKNELLIQSNVYIVFSSSVSIMKGVLRTSEMACELAFWLIVIDGWHTWSLLALRSGFTSLNKGVLFFKFSETDNLLFKFSDTDLFLISEAKEKCTVFKESTLLYCTYF